MGGLPGAALDVGERGVELEPRHCLRARAVHVRHRAVVVDALGDAPREVATLRVVLPALARDRMRRLVLRERGFAAERKELRADLLDRDLQVGREHDRVEHVPSVEADELGLVGTGRTDVDRRASVGRGVRAHPPCAPDVVLEARATDRRQLVVAVAEDLDLAFAVPVARVDHTDADRAAQEATRSLEAVDDHEVALLHRRVLTTEPHVQVSRAVVERPEGVDRLGSRG